MSRETYNYKRHAISIAKDLLYPSEVIEKLKEAYTENEICRIMTTARKEMED